MTIIDILKDWYNEEIEQQLGTSRVQNKWEQFKIDLVEEVLDQLPDPMELTSEAAAPFMEWVHSQIIDQLEMRFRDEDGWFE